MWLDVRLFFVTVRCISAHSTFVLGWTNRKIGERRGDRPSAALWVSRIGKSTESGATTNVRSCGQFRCATRLRTSTLVCDWNALTAAKRHCTIGLCAIGHHRDAAIACMLSVRTLLWQWNDERAVIKRPRRTGLLYRRWSAGYALYRLHNNNNNNNNNVFTFTSTRWFCN